MVPCTIYEFICRFAPTIQWISISISWKVKIFYILKHIIVETLEHVKVDPNDNLNTILENWKEREGRW